MRKKAENGSNARLRLTCGKELRERITNNTNVKCKPA